MKVKSIIDKNTTNLTENIETGLSCVLQRCAKHTTLLLHLKTLEENLILWKNWLKVCL